MSSVPVYYKLLQGDVGATGLAGGTSSYLVKDAPYTASHGESITVTQATTITLPPSPSVGDWVKILIAGTFAVTVDGNGNNIDKDYWGISVAHPSKPELTLVFVGGTTSWVIASPTKELFV